MDYDNNYKEVLFEDFCERCKHFRLDEVKDPCNECLEVGAREMTWVPLYFEEAK